ncbi:MAG: class I SAM-dependent methyltransferase [Rhodospirillales bacterium]|nr:class I SAM-dependent methyltransferase [Rhodospirillales bacterium]
MFETCEICGAHEWKQAYNGTIRDGTFGSIRENAIVAKCSGCGAERLGEEWCLPESHYETGEYRTKLRQELNASSYFQGHDNLQIFALQTLPLPAMRGKNVADVGCAGGSFLDHVRGLANRIIAIEPFSEYHESLTSRGYEVYPFADKAASQNIGTIDFATSFQVIEHTDNPRQFLADIRPMLKPDGLLYLSTPNRNDVLMSLLPDDYPSFFYRVVHRWYFNADSLAQCARLAGYEVVDTHFVHRYSMGNAMRWLRDCRPTGNSAMNGLDHGTDMYWKGYLEKSGTSDCLFMALRPKPCL